jgi:hypothetical protein
MDLMRASYSPLKPREAYIVMWSMAPALARCEHRVARLFTTLRYMTLRNFWLQLTAADLLWLVITSFTSFRWADERGLRLTGCTHFSSNQAMWSKHACPLSRELSFSNWNMERRHQGAAAMWSQDLHRPSAQGGRRGSGGTVPNPKPPIGTRQTTVATGSAAVTAKKTFKRVT